MPKKKPHTIEEAGIKVRLYRRGEGRKATIYLDYRFKRPATPVEIEAMEERVRETGKGRVLDHVVEKDRFSLGTSVMAVAEEKAREFCRTMKAAADEASGKAAPAAPPAELTIGDLFDAYVKSGRIAHFKGRPISPAQQAAARARIAMFTDAWGEGFLVSMIDQTRVDVFTAKRRYLEVLPPSMREPKDPSRPGRGYRKPRPVRDGTIDADFRWLRSVLIWATGYRVGTNGEELLAKNPLKGCAWPTEKNPLQPVASHQRFASTMEHVNEVDPTGRLRCILALARYTGRRESAICQLHANDLLLTEERIRIALATAGMNEADAAHMPDGAIRWRGETDKMGLLFVSPIGPEARDAVDDYLRQNPRLGDVPLFPSTDDAKIPIHRRTAARLLLDAETRAELPKLRGGTFHPYRRLWATERGRWADADVAAAGGWKDARTVKRYQKPTPANVYAAVANRA